MGKRAPSVDLWLREAKAAENAGQCGMYLVHSGTVRRTARAAVRDGAENAAPVTGMLFSFDAEKAARAVEEARRMPGIFHVRVWLNEGRLAPGDDVMLALVGGDIRPHVVDALQRLVETLKTQCVSEEELTGGSPAL